MLDSHLYRNYRIVLFYVRYSTVLTLGSSKTGHDFTSIVALAESTVVAFVFVRRLAF